MNREMLLALIERLDAGRQVRVFVPGIGDLELEPGITTVGQLQAVRAGFPRPQLPEPPQEPEPVRLIQAAAQALKERGITDFDACVVLARRPAPESPTGFKISGGHTGDPHVLSVVLYTALSMFIAEPLTVTPMGQPDPLAAPIKLDS